MTSNSIAAHETLVADGDPCLGKGGEHAIDDASAPA